MRPSRCAALRRGSSLALAASLSLAWGCSKEEKAPTGTERARKNAPVEPAASASAAASGSAGSGPPVCKVEQEKVWTRWANRDAGVTFVPLEGGRLAFGVADGESPRVLVFTRLGTGTLVEVPLAKGSKLAERLALSEGRRTLFRVSPALDASREVTAYVDYRDEYPDGKRRVACVPAGSDEGRLVYDEDPLVSDGKLGGLAAAVADAGTDKPEVVTELQQCRTFVNPGGRSAWAAASRLRLDKLPNRSLEWSWQWFIDPGRELPLVVLREVELEQMPTELPQYEPLEAQRLVDGTYLMTAREKQTLWLWGLSAAHQPRGEPKSYSGGVPTRPCFSQDGADWWLLSSRRVEQSHQLGAAKLSGAAPELPAEIARLQLQGLGASLAEPGLVRVGDHRWMSVHTGGHHDGQLRIVNVDEKLQPKGPAFLVSDPDETVHTSRLTALENGELLVVYIQNGAPGADLVSKRLTCWVR